MIKIAAYSFSVIALLAAAFPCALALGMPWAERAGRILASALVLVAYCGVAVLAHIFTPRNWERIVWLPLPRRVVTNRHVRLQNDTGCKWT